MADQNLWISVKDKLPSDNDIYLVTNGETVTIRMFRTKKDFFTCWNAVGNFSDWDGEDWVKTSYNVTHWMPLPELPIKNEEDKNGGV